MSVLPSAQNSVAANPPGLHADDLNDLPHSGLSDSMIAPMGCYMVTPDENLSHILHSKNPRRRYCTSVGRRVFHRILQRELFGLALRTVPTL